MRVHLFLALDKKGIVDTTGTKNAKMLKPLIAAAHQQIKQNENMYDTSIYQRYKGFHTDRNSSYQRVGDDPSRRMEMPWPKAWLKPDWQIDTIDT